MMTFLDGMKYETANLRVVEYSQRYGIRTFEFRFLNGDSSDPEAICRKTQDAEDFELTELADHKISFRYRSQRFLWIEEQDKALMAMDLVDELARKILLGRKPAIVLDESEPESMTFGRWYW